jgi:hypothetical protein
MEVCVVVFFEIGWINFLFLYGVLLDFFYKSSDCRFVII